VTTRQALMGGDGDDFHPTKNPRDNEMDAKRCSMTMSETPAKNPLLRESAGHRIALAQTLNP